MSGAFTDAEVISIPVQPANPKPTTIEIRMTTKELSVPTNERSASPTINMSITNINGTRLDISR